MQTPSSPPRTAARPPPRSTAPLPTSLNRRHPLPSQLRLSYPPWRRPWRSTTGNTSRTGSSQGPRFRDWTGWSADPPGRRICTRSWFSPRWTRRRRPSWTWTTGPRSSSTSPSLVVATTPFRAWRSRTCLAPAGASRPLALRYPRS